MRLVAYETFTVSLELELRGYLSYLMTESNIAAAVSAGVALTDIRSWCEEGLHPFFQGPLPIEFRSYFACLGQSD